MRYLRYAIVTPPPYLASAPLSGERETRNKETKEEKTIGELRLLFVACFEFCHYPLLLLLKRPTRLPPSRPQFQKLFSEQTKAEQTSARPAGYRHSYYLPSSLNGPIMLHEQCGMPYICSQARSLCSRAKTSRRVLNSCGRNGYQNTEHEVYC